MNSPATPPDGRRFAGLILAGGEGRRFGGPKAFARLPDGRLFVEACRDVLAGGGARPVAATLPPRHAGHEIPGLRQIPLPEAGLDMLASLRWGLRHLLSDAGWSRVVVLPVDHPLARSETVRQLAAAAGEAAVPSFRSRRGHPVVLSRHVATELAGGELGGATLRDVLAAVEPVEVPVDDPGVLANCNTPDALRAALNELTL